jgi:hypothetical protein
MACRGTGSVISNLGGAPSTVTCPWCGGSGVRVPGRDAQAAWLADRAERDADETPAGATAEAPAETSVEASAAQPAPDG